MIKYRLSRESGAMGPQAAFDRGVRCARPLTPTLSRREREKSEAEVKERLIPPLTSCPAGRSARPR